MDDKAQPKADQGRPNYSMHPDYESLPGCMKAVVSAKEYAWLGSDGRAKLISDYTDPQTYDESGA